MDLTSNYLPLTTFSSMGAGMRWSFEVSEAKSFGSRLFNVGEITSVVPRLCTTDIENYSVSRL